MSKAIGVTGEGAVSSFAPQQRDKGFLCSKPGNSSKAVNHGAVTSASTSAQKMPRTTHRHHRKPESNLNHLLNFSYSRPAAPSNLSVRRSNKTTPSYGRGSGYHPLDKAHFVNANYRFVVHPSGDYRQNLMESDVPVPWEQVLQVLASVQTQSNSCPICLESIPIAPRMAKCGHIFCLPCVLRYLESEDMKTGKTTGKWRKCPICFDGIYAKDLRPVKWCYGDDSLPARGQDVTLQLIMRRTGSIFALPRDAESVAEDVVPWHNQIEVLEYARLLKGDFAYMISESDREVAELLAMKEQDESSFGDEGQWTATAIESIQDATSNFKSLGNAPKPKGAQSDRVKMDRQPVEYVQSESSPTIFIQEETPVATHKHKFTREEDQLESPNGDAYYFYQPRTGSHYYLAPLDIRILKKAFSSFVSFPSALIAKVEHTTTVTVDEDLRRRTKYLSHLPLGCEVTFLECDWSGVLENDVIKFFKTDTDKRKKKRHDKAVSEESARRRAQIAEERRERAGLGDLQWHDETTSYFARNDESNTYEVFADEQNQSGDISSVHSGSLPGGSLERKSIWGTALPTEPERPSAAEDDAWKEQLEKFYEESAISASIETSSAATPGKKAKTKKKKLVLMSSGGGRGMG